MKSLWSQLWSQWFWYLYGSVRKWVISWYLPKKTIFINFHRTHCDSAMDLGVPWGTDFSDTPANSQWSNVKFSPLWSHDCGKEAGQVAIRRQPAYHLTVRVENSGPKGIGMGQLCPVDWHGSTTKTMSQLGMFGIMVCLVGWKKEVDKDVHQLRLSELESPIYPMVHGFENHMVLIMVSK